MKTPLEDETALLQANTAFYNAFITHDFDAMANVWAKVAPICCIHPGWPPLIGREAVLEGWRRILNNPAQPSVQMLAPRVTLWGDVALVLCFERVQDQYLVASNIFVREGKGWKLAHHQAGPVAAPSSGEVAEEEPEPEDGDDDLTPSGTIH